MLRNVLLRSDIEREAGGKLRRHRLNLSLALEGNLRQGEVRIEAVKEKVSLLPMNLTVLSSLRETAKLYTTHYSTMIEGNHLKSAEVAGLTPEALQAL